MKNKNKKFGTFFGKKIKKLVYEVNSGEESFNILDKLSKYEHETETRIRDFEKMYNKASNKLKTLIIHNPHIQAFLMGAKSGLWITFEEMFPGDINNWLYILKLKNLYSDRSLDLILDEITSLNPNYIKLKNDLIVDLTQVKDIISSNLDIFSSFRDSPYLSITKDETLEICKKIALSIEIGRIEESRCMLGLILGYPRKQVLIHQMIDSLDLQILIPKLNDFSRYGFYQKTLKKERLNSNRTILIDTFTELETLDRLMNEESQSFEEQKAYHHLIKNIINNKIEFFRKMIFKHYFLKEITKNSTEIINQYLNLSFPRLSFPKVLNFVSFGMYFIEYVEDIESEYIKTKILLSIKKVQNWQSHKLS